MFIAPPYVPPHDPPQGYEIRENATCRPIQHTYGSLNNAITACPSCMVFGNAHGFSTCYPDADIKVSTRGFRLYIKSK